MTAPCPVCGPASPRVICVHNYPGKPLASSPSATDTPSVDPIASGAASTEASPNTSQGSGGEDGALRAAASSLGDAWERYSSSATVMDGHTSDCDYRCKRTAFLRCSCGLAEVEAAIKSVIAAAFPPTSKTAPKPVEQEIAENDARLRAFGRALNRPYSVASPARLDGDASGRGA